MKNKKKWKASIYNIVLPYKNSQTLFNTVSSHFLPVNEEQFKTIDKALNEVTLKGQCNNSELENILSSFSFIVPYELNEIEKQHQKFLNNKLGKDLVLFAIAPTMRCNLSCSYCFQQDVEKVGVMSPEIQIGVVKLFREVAKNGKTIVVKWFGGEPLLAFEIIKSLSRQFKQICNENDVHYYSEMTTNGTLLTKKIINEFKDISLKAIQITLDGLPETFAYRKEINLKKAKKFYSFLIKEMPSILDIVGNVTLRINVDKDNIDESKELIKWFKKESVVDKRIDFRLGFLGETKGLVECIPHDCFKQNDHAIVEMEFNHFLAEHGFKVYGFPAPLNHPCMAAKNYSYAIDPLGKIGKCVPAIGHPGALTYSQIDPDNIKKTIKEISMNVTPYSDFDPFKIPKCIGCKIMPICLGECPRVYKIKKDFKCSILNKLPEKIRFFNWYYTNNGPI